eukprot:5581019-Amphidinium_carterae.1
MDHLRCSDEGLRTAQKVGLGLLSCAACCLLEFNIQRSMDRMGSSEMATMQVSSPCSSQMMYRLPKSSMPN